MAISFLKGMARNMVSGCCFFSFRLATWAGGNGQTAMPNRIKGSLELSLPTPPPAVDVYMISHYLYHGQRISDPARSEFPVNQDGN